MRIEKVKFYTNRINFDITPIINYAKQYNLERGIDLHIDIEPINVMGYKSSEFVPQRPAVIENGIVIVPAVNYCILLGAEKLVTIDPSYNSTVFMFDQLEWRTPPGSQYPLKPDTPTSNTILVNGKPFINFGVYSPDLNSAEIGLIHEFMHDWAKIAVSEGYEINDCMDVMTLPDGEIKAYYLNDEPTNPNSNFSNMWEQFYNVGYLKYE